MCQERNIVVCLISFSVIPEMTLGSRYYNPISFFFFSFSFFEMESFYVDWTVLELSMNSQRFTEICCLRKLRPGKRWNSSLQRFYRFIT